MTFSGHTFTSFSTPSSVTFNLIRRLQTRTITPGTRCSLQPTPNGERLSQPELDRRQGAKIHLNVSPLFAPDNTFYPK